MVLNVRTSVTVCQMEGVISRLVLANVMNSILVRSVVTVSPDKLNLCQRNHFHGNITSKKHRIVAFCTVWQYESAN